MKLSNKILIGFFGFLFLYLTAVFAEIRITGTPNFIDQKNSIAETAELSGVSYVILNDINKNVKVTSSDSARLEVRSHDGGILKKMSFAMAGDTLKLSGVEIKNIERIKITVFVPAATFKGIVVNRSSSSIEGLTQNALSIVQNDGKVWMSENSISSIQTNLSRNSVLEIFESKLDTLSATVDDSRLQVVSTVELLKGSVQNEGSLYMHDVRDVRVKRDRSSKINMYQL